MKEEAPGRLLEEGAPIFSTMQPSLFLHCSGAHGHDKIGCRCCTHILDSVFIIRMHEPDRAWPKSVAVSVDGEFHGSFPNEPHFGMYVMVRGMRHAAGRQHRFMDFQRFAC